MGIDMRGFKVVYKERVYNALNMNIVFEGIEEDETGIAKPKFLDVVIINEDGNVCIIHDEIFMFQFIRITQQGA